MATPKVKIKYALGAMMDGHGPIEHYKLCRGGFGQSPLRAARSTWLAYWVNWR